MAYVDKIKKDELNQEADSEILSNEPSGNYNTPGAVSGSDSTSRTGTSGKKGTGFTNLVEYVNANKPQASRMASEVAGTVKGVASEAGKAGSAFNLASQNAINSNKIEDTVSQDIMKNPEQLANERRAEFDKAYNASYKGPLDVTAVENYNDVMNKYNTAIEKGTQAGSFGGRQALLKDQYKQPKYSQGEVNLDSFLAGQTNDLDNVRQSYGQNSNFATGWEDLTSNINKQAEEAKNITNTTRENVRKALESEVGNIGSKFEDYTSQAANQNLNNRQVYQNLVNNLNSDNKEIRDAAYANIGLSAAEGGLLKSKNYNPGQMIAIGQGIKAGGIASAADKSRLQSLYSLANKNVDSNYLDTGDSTVYSVENAQLQNAKDAALLQKQLQDSLAAAQEARQSEFNKVKAKLRFSPTSWEGASEATGLSPEDIKFLVNRGVRIQDYLSQGTGLNIGDIASDEQRGQWSNLMQSLGLVDSGEFSDIQDEGSAYNVDRTRLANDLARERAEYQAYLDAKYAEQPIPEAAQTSEGRPGIIRQEVQDTADLTRSEFDASVEALNRLSHGDILGGMNYFPGAYNRHLDKAKEDVGTLTRSVKGKAKDIFRV